MRNLNYDRSIIGAPKTHRLEYSIIAYISQTLLEAMQPFTAQCKVIYTSQKHKNAQE